MVKLEAKEEQMEDEQAHETETHYILFKERLPPLLELSRHVIIDKRLLNEIFWRTVGPPMHRKITREPPNNKGIVSVGVAMDPILYDLVIHAPTKTLASEIEVRVRFGYAVYNERGRLQWPHEL